MPKWYNKDMGFFFGSQEKSGYVAVFDVRDSCVEGMIVAPQNSAPEILFYESKENIFQSKVSGRKLLASTNYNVSRIASEIQKTKWNKPEKIVCILGPHLFVSQTRNIYIKYLTSAVITEKIISDLVAKEIDGFIKEHKDSGFLHNYNDVLEQKIMRVKLNGYDVADPVGKRANEVEISLYLSIAPKTVLSGLKRGFAEAFHHENVEFHTSLFSMFSTIRDIFHSASDYLIIDVAGETTEAAVIRGEMIEASLSVPFGTNHLLRAIMKRFSTIYGEAESMVRLWSQGFLQTEIAEKVSVTAKEKGAEWRQSIKEVLKKDFHGYVPHDFYLNSDDAFARSFQDFLIDADMPYMMSLGKPPEVKILETQMFENFAKNKTGRVIYPHAYLSAIFVNKVLK